MKKSLAGGVICNYTHREQLRFYIAKHSPALTSPLGVER